MRTVLQELEAHPGGVMLALLVVAVCLLVINWVLWLFGWGRFKPGDGGGRVQSIGYVITDFFVQIINDFRHLLALVVMFVFAAALIVAVWPGLVWRNIDMVTSGLQAVAASLGGLIGSIIGYYFGESAASRRIQADTAPTGPPIQDTGSPTSEIKPVVPPPPARPAARED